VEIESTSVEVYRKELLKLSDYWTFGLSSCLRLCM